MFLRNILIKAKPWPGGCNQAGSKTGLLQEVHNVLATVEELTGEQLGDALQKYGVQAPETGNDISRPFPFNLMFRTSIGPRGDQVGYLRPETAQGIFVNFK